MYESRCGVDQGGRSDDQKDVRRGGRLLGLRPDFGRKRLTEPDHAGSFYPATGAMRRDLGQRRARVVTLAAAERASKGPDIAMDFQNAPGACAVVETVDVLRDEGEIAGAFLQLGKGAVASVRLRFRDQAAAPVISFPDEFGIAGEGLGRG